MIGSPVRRALAAHNGGPGLTEDELVAQTGVARAVVRLTLHKLVFDERVVTCTAEGRFRFGDPTPDVLRMGQ